LADSSEASHKKSGVPKLYQHRMCLIAQPVQRMVGRGVAQNNEDFEKTFLSYQFIKTRGTP
jgi:hypothetical protein